MRTKTLLLTAAVSAAGVATSLAQAPVYSVNAVGYVNTTLVAGFNLISNPLDNKAPNGNVIKELFKTLPINSIVYKVDGGSFKNATMDEFENVLIGAAADLTLMPGEGAFVRLPGGTPNTTVTFVGEVPQGTLTVTLNTGLQIVSSKVPQAGTATALGLAGEINDRLFHFYETDPDGAGPIAAQAYRISTFDEFDNAWVPALNELAVGEAFFYQRAAAGSASWTRTFSVN